MLRKDVVVLYENKEQLFTTVYRLATQMLPKNK